MISHAIDNIRYQLSELGNMILSMVSSAIDMIPRATNNVITSARNRMILIIIHTRC